MTVEDDIGDMLSAVDKEILVSLLLCGADSPHNLARYTSRHKQTIQERLGKLQDEELVRNKGAGVYDVTYQGLNFGRVLLKDTQIADKIDCGASTLNERG